MSEPLRQIRPAAAPSIVEAQLLGALCELGGSARELLEVSGLTPEDLRDQKVRMGWRAVVLLVQAGLPVSLETVFSRGRSENLLCEADGNWLASLTAANVLTRETFSQLAGDLRRGILGRQIAELLETTARELRAGSFAPATVAASLDLASDALAKSDVLGTTAASDVIDQADNWERREKFGGTPGILTRVKVLDDLTTPRNGIGGIPPKFAVVCGKPGVGKNIFLAGMIRAQLIAEPDLQIGGFFLEDGSKWLLKRWTALDLEIPVGAVGVVKLTDEQRTKLRSLEPGYHELLKRVQTFRYRRVRPADMIHLSRSWIHHFGVRLILLDDLNHLDHRPPPFGHVSRLQFVNQKRNEQVADAAEAFAELADKREIPVLVTAHTIRAETERDEFRAPRLAEIAETSGIGKVCRFALGLWRTKSRALRVTVLKNQEGPGEGETLELETHTEAAVLDVDGGRLINVEQEAREEKQAKQAEKEMETAARQIRTRKLRDDMLAKTKAEAEKLNPPAPPPQLELLPTSPPTEPKP